MGLFSKKPRVDPAEIIALRAELVDLRSRLESSEHSKTVLETHVIQLDAATSALAARTHMVDDVTLRLAEVDVIKRQVAQLDVVQAKIASLDGQLNAKMADLAERVEVTSTDAKTARDQTATLDERISNVSTELANQLGELGREIDGLASSQAANTPTTAAAQAVAPEVLDQLTSAQIRLANEQARYEIAFRQDLAHLAEQIRRSRS